MEIRINIAGIGIFSVRHANVPSLMQWLSQHAVKLPDANQQIREVVNNDFTGRELLVD